MSTRTLRIGLVDDHAVVRAGYRRLLEMESMEVVAEFADADSAYAALSGAEPCPVDLLILDLSLPGRSGLDLLRRLRMRCPGLRVLMFTMHDNTAMVVQCLRAGASGFVTKSSAPEVLVDAVRRVSWGEQVLSPDIAAAVRQDMQPAPHLGLSTREFDVLQALIQGASIDSISRRLHLSPKTVSNYQALVRQKLGVNNAVELLRYAREHGLGG